MSSNSTNSTIDGIASKLQPAINALLDAVDYADDAKCDHWEFAIAIQRFKKLGLSETELRWLVKKGFVAHAREITRKDDRGREFRASSNLSFCKRTCFVLTPAGAEYARIDFKQTATSKNDFLKIGNATEVREKESSKSIDVIPVWDSERRELRVNGDVVKQFKWCAANQERILTTFEEEQWPVRILDPLPPHSEQDSKRRLSDTIKCLNRKQKCPLIHFRGDGTGEGVIWELVEPVAGSN